jgi:DNA topoisomerase-3
VNNELLKSAELTGLWEKKLRDIEKGQYEVATFMDEMKQMVSDIVFDVKRDVTAPKIEVVETDEKPKAVKDSPVAKTAEVNPPACPRCGQGVMLKGKKAWGCSRFKEGCSTLVPFEFLGKRLSDNQIADLLEKKKTDLIKGFSLDGQKVEGRILFDENFALRLEKEEPPQWKCPKCGEGLLVKGKNAWGCNRFREGCRVLIPFEFMGKKITEKQAADLVLNGKTNPLKGFVNPAGGSLLDGRLVWDNDFNVVLENS